MKSQLLKQSLMTRESLLLRVKDRDDHSAWEEFTLLYEPFLRSFLLKQRIPTSDCEDILQEVVIKIYKNLEMYQGRNHSRFRTWMIAIVKNSMLDHLRKQKRLRHNHQQLMQERLLEIENSPIEENYEKAWQLNLCKVALENIKKQFSGKAIQVFELTLNETPIETICKNLDLKKDSIYRLRGRVKKALKNEIERMKDQYE